VANGQAYALGEGEECIKCEVERGEELERYSLWKSLRHNSLTEDIGKHLEGLGGYFRLIRQQD
jgi:hypothetical protein